MCNVISRRLLTLAVFLASVGFALMTFADHKSVSRALTREGSIPAAQVKAGAVIFRYKAERAETLTGFYTRLTNCVGPTRQPVVIGLRIGDALAKQRASIPVYPDQLYMVTRTGGLAFPPLDVAQEYRVALAKPLELKRGDSITLEVISAAPLSSGVTAGLQFAGTWPLVAMRDPFRATKAAGPVSRIAWSNREIICTGNQEKFDPMCAPQNNSGVVSDSDGSLYQFTSYYSVDEQYGGGRGGSFARIYAYTRGPADKTWRSLGLIADPTPIGLTYCGDPFAFRDLQGKPCLLYTTVDGTNGFADWKLADAWIIQSKTMSFAGPWSKPHALFRGVSQHKYARVNCLRVYPRPKTNDYVVVWLYGSNYKAGILPNLTLTLTEQQLAQPGFVVLNQEEGGGGFVRGEKGYLSTWQIPGINDPTSIQRLYEFDLYDPLNPEKWVALPGSWGWNDGANPIEDGGATADAWSLSYLPESDTLWATSVVWSVSQKKNSILACSVPWSKRFGTTFHYGCPRAFQREIAPVVEYAINDTCALSATITAAGPEAAVFLFLAPSLRPLHFGGIAVEVSDRGARLVAYSEKGDAQGLTAYQEPPFVPNQPYRVRLARSGYTITGSVNDRTIGPVTITDPAQKAFLVEPQRFKFYGWQGCRYWIRDAVLVDGPSDK